jgi:hypothetical protein
VQFNGIAPLRLPLEPLARELRAAGTSDLAHILGLSRWTVLRMRRVGITVKQADEYAVRFAGTHPACIWGYEFYSDIQAEIDGELKEVAA